MKRSLDRRKFIKSLALTGAGMSVLGSSSFTGRIPPTGSKRVGIIGLDTSHSPAFTDLINDPERTEASDFEVVAAYPYGSRDLEVSYSRIPGITQSMRERGIEIVESIDELLAMSDVILLETNDGHPRREQSLQVMETGKPMFADKPIAGSLKDTVAIIEASRQYNSPVFSSSSLRYIHSAQAIRHDNIIGEVMGTDTYSPASIEPSHPDFFWYGIHGVEMLFTVMGTGCRSVSRIITDYGDVTTGIWDGGRVGTFRGIREGRSGLGGTAFGSEEILPMGGSEGYWPLIEKVLEFYRTGITPVSLEETLEIYAFMEAADESKRQRGAPVTLDYVLSKARQ